VRNNGSQGTNKPQTHLTVLGGAGHAPGFIVRPGKDDDRVKNLNVVNMGTVVEEALCVGITLGQENESSESTDRTPTFATSP
jgi:hypothetical protein